MAYLARVASTSTKLVNLSLRSIQIVPSRACGWPHEWKPGPLPKTQEEREQAAKKYNMIVEDYETYPEGSGFGDYPKLPVVCQDARDPYEEFDFYYRRRNYGEPLHIDYDLFQSEKANFNVVNRYSWPVMIFSFLAWAGSVYLICYICRYFDLHFERPLKYKQYPADRTETNRHYTFEPLD